MEERLSEKVSELKSFRVQLHAVSYPGSYHFRDLDVLYVEDTVASKCQYLIDIRSTLTTIPCY